MSSPRYRPKSKSLEAMLDHSRVRRIRVRNNLTKSNLSNRTNNQRSSSNHRSEMLPRKRRALPRERSVLSVKKWGILGGTVHRNQHQTRIMMSRNQQAQRDQPNLCALTVIDTMTGISCAPTAENVAMRGNVAANGWARGV